MESSELRCYACHRRIKAPEAWQAYLEDDDHAPVYIGPDCFKRVDAAGADGYKPPKGGPRLFATPNLAERACRV